MKIISSLEKEPRKIYTGCIGFFSPRGEAVFNVAIRTLLIENSTKKGEMGIGSGIVYDSDPYKEFEECRLKANFITQKREDFKLIETILWQSKKGYFLLKAHLDRLLSSAKYFNFKFDREFILRDLNRLTARFRKDSNYRIRLLLDRSGDFEISFARITNDMQLAKVKISDKKVFSGDVFLYHKTTNRDLYNKEHEKCRREGYFDTIFTNEKNQITEGAISNIIIKKGRFYYTPPVACGLLNGIFRKNLFRNNFPIKEQVLYKDDIKKADEIYMVNSIRGMLRTHLQ
jgi:para-aminobenzoate synthetase/4-amino-4-deoxychorismate lyase